MAVERSAGSGERARGSAPKQRDSHATQQNAGPQQAAPGRLQRALENPGAASAADLRALQRSLGNRAVSRLANSAAQRSADPASSKGGPVGPETEAALGQARGGGSPLPDPVRGPMEQAFGADFGPVRLHTDEQADHLNRSLSAKAFTHGSDIYFSRGAYSPGTGDGQRLLAHELTHVVQQSGGPATAQRKLSVGPADDAYEQEADRVAAQVLGGSRQGGAQRRAAHGIARTPAGVQRQEQQIGEGGPRIKNEDFEYEIIGHRLAYRKDTTGAGPWLDSIGYEQDFAGEATGYGFRVVLLMPKQGSGRTPILAFKGSNKIPDFIVDADPIAVGFLAFKHNQHKVKALIDQAGGRVDVTGHSLGGALAQHCASAFPGSVRRVVTFQAPGISMIQAVIFDSLGDNKPEVTHHVAKGDVVDLAGGKHLGGQTFVHGTKAKGLGGIGKGHTSYLLNSEALGEQSEGAGITEDLLVNLGLMGGKRENTTGEVEEHENYPYWARSFGVERVRETIGGLIGIPYGLIAGAGLAGKHAWKGMKAAGKGIWGGMKAAGKGIWSGMKAAGRGIKKGGQALGRGAVAAGKGLWGGMKALGQGLGQGAGALAQFLSSSFSSLFQKQTE